MDMVPVRPKPAPITCIGWISVHALFAPPRRLSPRTVYSSQNLNRFSGTPRIERFSTTESSNVTASSQSLTGRPSSQGEYRSGRSSVERMERIGEFPISSRSFCRKLSCDIGASLPKAPARSGEIDPRSIDRVPIEAPHPTAPMRMSKISYSLADPSSMLGVLTSTVIVRRLPRRPSRTWKKKTPWPPRVAWSRKARSFRKQLKTTQVASGIDCMAAATPRPGPLLVFKGLAGDLVIPDAPATTPPRPARSNRTRTSIRPKRVPDPPHPQTASTALSRGIAR